MANYDKKHYAQKGDAIEYYNAPPRAKIIKRKER